MPDPKKYERILDRFGHYAVESFHYLALFIIGCMVAWSAANTVFEILIVKKYASIDDILLLFIYLELGAMVGIYFKTNHMPVRFLIYVAITALTRLLISDIQHDHKADLDQVIITGSILILALYFSCPFCFLALPICYERKTFKNTYFFKNTPTAR